MTKRVVAFGFGLSLLGGSAAGCGTLTGAAAGAATDHSVEKSAIISAGVGGTAGALYDVYTYRRDRRDDD